MGRWEWGEYGGWGWGDVYDTGLTRGLVVIDEGQGFRTTWESVCLVTAGKVQFAGGFGGRLTPGDESEPETTKPQRPEAE